MKLSEMSTEELARTLCRLAPPLCRIAGDERVVRALGEASQAGQAQQPLLTAGGRLAQALTPLLLEEHAEDLWEALAVLTGKTAQDIRRQPGVDTLRALREVWDGELMRFFASAGIATKASC